MTLKQKKILNSRSKSPISARSGSAGRSVSPFSQKVSLVNPTTLLAPGAIDPSTSNIVEEEQPKRQAKWDIPPDTSTIGATQPGKSDVYRSDVLLFYKTKEESVPPGFYCNFIRYFIYARLFRFIIRRRTYVIYFDSFSSS